MLFKLLLFGSKMILNLGILSYFSCISHYSILDWIFCVIKFFKFRKSKYSSERKSTFQLLARLEVHLVLISSSSFLNLPHSFIKLFSYIFCLLHTRVFKIDFGIFCFATLSIRDSQWSFDDDKILCYIIFNFEISLLHLHAEAKNIEKSFIVLCYIFFKIYIPYTTKKK